MIVLDASLLIAHLDERDALHARAEEALEPDCCVLLAAHETAAQAIATFDDALARAAERSGLDTF